ncbi:serine/threonine protein kinase [Streptomyces armeniacus]|uniref:non-specific serine/threonine protein kinase n=1 Tax=Streptomyces armeniacus TaxID=83291 RepID=A0A345Y146_9ACTN|nr:serine/threonine-protein kinase [Streptomyces armeniacus]AXK37612.1 serine/threonine protein kinase [Streptomyces armeniacus]
MIEDRYELLEPIGSGGMGEVWKAHDRRLRRHVAVKGMLDQNAMTAGTRAAAMQRARREAEAIAKIEHRNVVTVHDQVETANQVWIVMKLLEARSLEDLLRTDRALAVPRAADIGLQMLQGLRAVHAASVVHRDVKPGNVLVRDDGLVILVDFGIATFEGAAEVTRAGTVIGTPSYLAPEIFASGSADRTAASDLWALGITLYKMVEGRVPFAGSEVWEVQENIRRYPDPPFRYAGPLAPVIQGLLSTDPGERLDAATAEVMLQEVLSDPPAPHSPPAAATRPPTAASQRGPGPAPVAPGPAAGAAAAASAPSTPEAPAPAAAAASGQGTGQRRGLWLKVAAAALCVALLATAGWLVANGDEDPGGKTDNAGQEGQEGQEGQDGGGAEEWASPPTTLKIGVKDDQPGLGLEKNGKRTGFEVELAYEIGRKMGYDKGKVELETVETVNRSSDLWKKKVHLVIASYSITDDRKKSGKYPVDFAGPYYLAGRGFLVREQSKRPISDSNELIDDKLEVCTAAKSTYEKELDKRGFNMKDPQPSTYEGCKNLLLEDKSPVYAVASDDVVLAGFEYADPDRLRRLNNIEGVEKYGIAMLPDSPILKGKVCSALREIKANGSWDRMYMDNLAPVMGSETPPGRPDLEECRK